MVDQEVVVPENVPEELREEVRERILKSQVKYQAAKVKQDAEKARRRQHKAEMHQKRETLKPVIEAGQKFFAENQNSIIFGRFELNEQFEIAYAAMKLDSQAGANNGYTLIKSTYAIKAPTDTWKDKVAHGLCGDRLMNPNNEWTATMSVPTMIWESGQNILQDAIHKIIESRILLLAPEIPQRMAKALFWQLEKKYKNRDKVEKLLNASKDALEQNDLEGAKAAFIKAMKLNCSEDDIPKGIAMLDAKHMMTRDGGGLLGSLLGGLVNSNEDECDCNCEDCEADSKNAESTPISKDVEE